jgi:hypothetical protein
MDRTHAQPLSATHGSLALGVPPSTPGTIFALAITGGIAIKPRQGRTVVFGRNRPEVHVCVSEDDPQISHITQLPRVWHLQKDERP